MSEEGAKPVTSHSGGRPIYRHSRSLPSRRGFWAATCIVTLLVLCAGGWWRIRYLRKAALSHWETRLSSVVDVTKFAIDAWIRNCRSESLELAARIGRSPSLFAGRPDTALASNLQKLQAQINEDLDSTQRQSGASDIWVVDQAGGVLARSESTAQPSKGIFNAATDAIQLGTEVVRGPVFDSRGKPILAFAAPVINHSIGGIRNTLGAIILAQDPNKFLFPLVSGETIPTQTGEYMLVAHSEEMFQILSPLRHPPTPALTINIPWANAPYLGRVAIESESASGEFTDFRGIPVIAVTRHISGSVGLIRQINTSEALDAFRMQVRTEALLALAILAMAGFAVLAYMRAERAARLREIASSEARMAGIINSAMDAIITLDSEQRITLFNHAAERMFGWSAEEVLGDTVDRFIPEPLRAAHRQHIATYGRSGDAARFISEHRNLHGLRRNGDKFPIEASISQLELEGRKIYLAIIRDISQRKRADRLLQQTEEKYRKLFEESKDAVFISSMEGKFLDINAAGVKLFGYDSKEELMQVNIPKELYANPPHRDEILRIYQARGYAENIEITIKRKDGTFRTVLETSTAMRDENGNIVALQGILRDITERKTLETQLLQAQKMEAIGQLAGGIAHDFNNILTAILGYSDLMRIDLSENDPRIRLIEEISKAGYRAASLIRQLLAFSRRQLMQPRNLELNSLVTEMDQMLHRLIGENINLAVNLDPQLGQVRADPGQIQQVILNLIVNARDAMPQGGSLTLHTSNTELEDGPEAQQLSAPPGRYIVLAVSDTGHGIDPEVQTRIFEPFFTTKDKGKGTGLGLSTVYGIVKQSGGFIAVQSEQRKGATFKIYLPRIEAPEVCPKPITASLVATLGGTETILLVEDEAAVRSLAREILSSYGYRVLEAANGGEALTLCRSYEREIHGILTDIVMPGMSGPELVRQLKPLYPRMKVLFVSGYSYAEMAQNQTLDPGSAFVPKPFTSVELAQAMRRLLDEGKSPTQSLSPSQYSP